MRSRFLRTQARVGADGEFGEFGFGFRIAGGKDGSKPGGEEANGDARDAGIFEREDGTSFAEESVRG